MKKFNTAPISGMQELTPALQAEFNRLKSGIAAAYAQHGFLNIETPTIDRTDILLAKAGGDTEKQIYKVIKTAEASEDADQALRFDHTVPLARYTVEHTNDLAFPFKVTQIARNFRGERPQKGRFREFYQCDVDVIGWNNLPIAYDAEVIATLIDALKVLPLPSFVVRVSNRKLLTGLLEAFNLGQHSAEIFSIVDHAEKVPPEKTVAALAELGLGEDIIVNITTFMRINGPVEDVVVSLRALGVNNKTFDTGVAELEEVMQTVALFAPGANVGADMLIVRGLDYYTGTVFETIVPEYREFGSVCSGGRYESLASHYTDQLLPGVGGSIGLTRLFAALVEHGLVQASASQPVDICLIPISANEYEFASEVAAKLRQDGRTVDLVLTDKKLGDKLKYASRVAKYAAVIGENEARSGHYTLRNLDTGEEQTI